MPKIFIFLQIGELSPNLVTLLTIGKNKYWLQVASVLKDTSYVGIINIIIEPLCYIKYPKRYPACVTRGRFVVKFSENGLDSVASLHTNNNTFSCGVEPNPAKLETSNRVMFPLKQ